MNAVAKIVRTVAGVVAPDTLLVTRAIEYARKHSEPYLFNHVMRSWLFAVRLAQIRDVAHDRKCPLLVTSASASCRATSA